MGTRYILLLLSVFTLLVSSCRNKDVVQPAVPKPTAWSSLDTVGTTFQYQNKIGIFAYADQQGLALGVPTGYLFLDKPTSKEFQISGGFLDYTAKPVLSNGFYFMTPPAGSFLLMKPIYDYNTYWRDGAGIITIENIDSTLSFPDNYIPVAHVVGNSNLGYKFCAYNDKQQLLLIVQQARSVYAMPYLLTFQFLTETVANGTLTEIRGIKEYKVNKLRIEPDLPGIRVFNVLSSGSSFLLSAEAGVGKEDSQGRPTDRYAIFKIKPDGSYQSVLEPGSLVTNLFNFAGKVYAYSYGGSFWESADQGDTWRKMPGALKDISGEFYDIDGRLVIASFDSLYEINFGTGKVRKLYTKELAGNLITGVASYNGNVYVSTLGGFFTKKLADFWQYN